MEKTYFEKLKDPRWQKKRLEIFNRDNWACTNCGDTKSILHVHHKTYSNNNPWEIENEKLTTLCEKCHEQATIDMKNFDLLLKDIKNRRSDLVDVIFGFMLGCSYEMHPNLSFEIKNYEVAEGLGKFIGFSARQVIDATIDGCASLDSICIAASKAKAS